MNIVCLLAAAVIALSTLSCARSAPTLGLQHTSQVEFIPGGTPPEYCKNKDYRMEPACFATAPEYCEDPYYSESPSCLVSSPSYCAQKEFAGSPSCFSSAPAYCEDSYYSKAGACRGTMPNYCNDAYFSKEPSCLRLSEGKLGYFCRRLDTKKLCPEDYR